VGGINMGVKVKFQSETEVKVGKSLLKAAKDAGIKIKDSCDGKGTCGKCVVKVISGNLTEPTNREIKELGAETINEGYRLACQAEVVDGEVIVEVVK
jgi:ferredoxin